MIKLLNTDNEYHRRLTVKFNIKTSIFITHLQKHPMIHNINYDYNIILIMKIKRCIYSG